MRTAAAGLCGLLAALLLPLAMVSVWLHTVVADTDAYLARVDPLAADEEVRQAVEDAVVEGLLQEVDLGLVGDAAEDAVRRVAGAVVDSEAFDVLWRRVQEAAHSDAVSFLRSHDPLGVRDVVEVPLDAFVEAVREQVAELGLGLDQALGQVTLSLPLASSQELEAVRSAYQVLERLWLLLPVAAVALALLALALARRRLRVLAVLGGLASAACLCLLVLMGVGRRLLVEDSPSEPARALTGRVADAVSAPLRDTAVTGVLVGAAVLVVAAVLGLLVRAVRRTSAS